MKAKAKRENEETGARFVTQFESGRGMTTMQEEGKATVAGALEGQNPAISSRVRQGRRKSKHRCHRQPW